LSIELPFIGMIKTPHDDNSVPPEFFSFCWVVSRTLPSVCALNFEVPYRGFVSRCLALCFFFTLGGVNERRSHLPGEIQVFLLGAVAADNIEAHIPFCNLFFNLGIPWVVLRFD